jgi:hypothetical protein
MSKKEQKSYDEMMARMDLDTMVQAKLIQNDPKRVAAMAKVAQEVVDQQVVRAQATIAVSKMKALAKSRSRKKG